MHPPSSKNKDVMSGISMSMSSSGSDSHDSFTSGKMRAKNRGVDGVEGSGISSSNEGDEGKSRSNKPISSCDKTVQSFGPSTGEELGAVANSRFDRKAVTSEKSASEFLLFERRGVCFDR